MKHLENNGNWKYPVNNLRYRLGSIEGSSSNVFSKYKYINPFNLRNDDIENPNSGSKNKYKKFKGSNSCLNIRDIYGAKHGSLLKGISTNRNLNPLYPKYKYLGENEIKNENLTNFKNNSVSKKLDNNYIFDDVNMIKNDKIRINEKTNLNINNHNIITKSVSFELKNSNKELNRDNIKENNNNNNNKKDFKYNNEDIYDYISNLNELSPENDIKFDKNIYKKPDIYYPYKHDKTIFPHNKQHKQEYINYNPRLRSFQQIINEKIKLINQPKSNSIFNSPIKSYEDKMDDFFVKSTINMYKSQQKLKNNINAYYDIGFPEELKSPDIVPKF